MVDETGVTPDETSLAETILRPRTHPPERRKSLRRPCPKNCSVRAFTAKMTYTTRILDVSQTGLGLVCEESIPLETRMTLRLYEQGLQVKMLQAIVRHTTERVAGKGWLIGCELLQELPTKDVACLLSAEPEKDTSTCP